jgi:5-bromo-4-chloroindolyl phosphate hydrolysis protein
LDEQHEDYKVIKEKLDTQKKAIAELEKLIRQKANEINVIDAKSNMGIEQIMN